MQVHNTPVTGSFMDQRAKNWKPLGAGKLIVWMGITYKMGSLGRARASHYWMMDDDFGCDSIRSAMVRNRYMAITANLSFAPRGSWISARLGKDRVA